jgi:GNAT superfamily N-acetyltransferase
MLMTKPTVEVEDYRVIISGGEYLAKRTHSGLYCKFDLSCDSQHVGKVEVCRVPDNVKKRVPEEYHHWLYLCSLLVNPDYRRKDLGSWLVEEGKRFSISNKKPVLLIPEQEGDVPLVDIIRFYERNGFHQLKEECEVLGWMGGNVK